MICKSWRLGEDNVAGQEYRILTFSRDSQPVVLYVEKVEGNEWGALTLLLRSFYYSISQTTAGEPEPEIQRFNRPARELFPRMS